MEKKEKIELEKKVIKKPRVGGRAPGTPNKVTKEMREMFKDFAEDNFQEFLNSWKKITSSAVKCNVFIQACKFVIPAMTSVDLNSEGVVEKYIDQLVRLRDSDVNKPGTSS